MGDTIDAYQRFPTAFQSANETYVNEGLTTDSFDTLQKLILSELENVFDDLADVTAKFNDVVQKTCWTFTNEVSITQYKGTTGKGTAGPDRYIPCKPHNTLLMY